MEEDTGTRGADSGYLRAYPFDEWIDVVYIEIVRGSIRGMTRIAPANYGNFHASAPNPAVFLMYQVYV